LRVPPTSPHPNITLNVADLRLQYVKMKDKKFCLPVLHFYFSEKCFFDQKLFSIISFNGLFKVTRIIFVQSY
jgi:hypothetical protein